MVDAAKALAKTEDLAAVARLTVEQLRSQLRDIDEHGAHSEFADDKAFIERSMTTWVKRAGPAPASDLTERVLLGQGLEEMLVVSVEGFKLPPAEAKAWRALRKTPRLVKAMPREAIAPWFAELIAAYISRELQHIAQSRHKSSFSSKLADVPELLAALERFGMPAIFGPRAIRWANIAALSHDDAATAKALAAMKAAKPSAEEKETARKLKLRFG